MSNLGTFHSTIDRFNNEAIKRLEGECFEEALIRLQEADSILNFAVNCGKTISKALITTILHNRACAYQGLYKLKELSQDL